MYCKITKKLRIITKYSKFFSNFASNSYFMEPKRIKIKDKTFELTIPEAEILSTIRKLADELRNDYADRNPIFVTVLNGAFIFASDILRLIDFPCQFDFTKLKSYEGSATTGNIIEELPVSLDITGRHIIILEDIIETGLSMHYLVNKLLERNPASVNICTLSFKPEKCKVEGLPVKYVGMTLPEAFIVGYGLDYDQQGRELRDIYSLVEG